MPDIGESFADLKFPLAGIDLSMGLERQPPRQLPDGTWGTTTPVGVNVRGYEPSTDRSRGGARPGLVKYLTAPVVAGWIVQDLHTLVEGGMPQFSNSGRVVTLVAVSQGNVYYVVAGGTSWTLATNNTGNTPPLNLTGVLFSSENNQKLWYADGVNWVYYDALTNSLERWVATAGSLPVDSANNTPRLICTWRGRTVLSGLILDPQNWFMSAVSDPTDWDYSPLSVTPTQAVAGNNAPQGFVGDMITALVPYNDDVLIFGGDHTLYMLNGDPMAGGQLDLISDTIGMAWGIPWCKDPYGTLWFVSNKMGIYNIVPGQAPVRVSQQIEQLVHDVDTGANSIRLIWDDPFQGVHVFITPLEAAAATTHLFYEARSNAWWQERFANNNHNPVACCIFDGNLPTDRRALIGSWDGYVRSFGETATDDDGTAIASSVVLGPLLTKDFDDVLFKDLQGLLSSSSGAVTYAVYTGATAEIALASTAVVTGTWSAGRNLTNMIRRSGHALWVKLTSTVPWALEGVRARIAGQGKVRRRGV